MRTTVTRRNRDLARPPPDPGRRRRRGLRRPHPRPRARGAPVDVTLVDRRNFHLFQPLLYQVATGGLSANIATPLRALVKRSRTSASSSRGDRRRRRRPPAAVEGGEVPYDTLVLATGARHSYFGRPEWEARAPGLKTLEDATGIRAAHPLGLRGGRAGGGRGAAARAPHVRGRGGGTHGGGAGGGPRRDRPAHAPGRVPADRPLLGADPPRRGEPTASWAPTPPPSPPGPLAIWPGSGRGPHGDPRDGHPRGRRHSPAWRGAGGRQGADGPRAAGVEGSPLGRALAEAAGAGTDRAGRVSSSPT